jgi:protein-tyrosine phosphatase
MNRISILFVCMGNICRSPTAEGVFRHMLADRAPELDVKIDSAGTHAYHIGSTPDVRAQTAARERGVDLAHQAARVVGDQDFARFDYILAMDSSNLDYLKAMCPPEYQSRLHLFLEYAPDAGEQSVPDPYFGGQDGFGRVLDLVEQASAGLIWHLKRRQAAAAVVGARSSI